MTPPSRWRLHAEAPPGYRDRRFRPTFGLCSSGWKISLWLDRWQNHRLCCWHLASGLSHARHRGPNDDPIALNQKVTQLIEQGKYQVAIPIAERAVEEAKRARGPEHPETAEALNNLGLLFKKTGDYAKAEPLYQEALRIRKNLDTESREVATSLNNLGLLYQAMHEYAKAEPL